MPDAGLQELHDRSAVHVGRDGTLSCNKPDSRETVFDGNAIILELIIDSFFLLYCVCCHSFATLATSCVG